MAVSGNNQQNITPGHHGHILLSRGHRGSLPSWDPLETSSQYAAGGGRVWKCVLGRFAEMSSQEVLLKILAMSYIYYLELYLSDIDDTLEAIDKIAIHEGESKTEATSLWKNCQRAKTLRVLEYVLMPRWADEWLQTQMLRWNLLTVNVKSFLY